MASETEDKGLNPTTLHQGVSEVLRNPEKGFYLLAVLSETVVGQVMITSNGAIGGMGIFGGYKAFMLSRIIGTAVYTKH